MEEEIIEVYIKQRATTSYDKSTIFKLISIGDLFEYNIIEPNNNKIKKYFDEHPKLKEKYERLMLDSGPAAQTVCSTAYLLQKKRSE